MIASALASSGSASLVLPLARMIEARSRNASATSG